MNGVKNFLLILRKVDRSIYIGVLIWVIYCLISPGNDLFGNFTNLTLHRERLIPYMGTPWTHNPGWLVPFMLPFVYLPGRIALYIWLALSIAGIIWASHKYKANPIFALLSAQFLIIASCGQLEGFVIAGLTLAFFSLNKNRWYLIAIGLLLATFKFNLVLAPVIAIWWWSGKERWKVLGLCAAVALLTVVFIGPWPVWLYKNIFMTVSSPGYYQDINISIGLVATPLFIPAILFKMCREKRILALAATMMLISPYMPYYSTLLLFCFPIPSWMFIFAIIGFIPGLFPYTIFWNSIILFPISILIWLYLPYLRLGWQMLKARGIKSPIGSDLAS